MPKVLLHMLQMQLEPSLAQYEQEAVVESLMATLPSASIWQMLCMHCAFIGRIVGAGMQACAAAGQLEEARSLLQAMKAAGFDPDVRAFNILLKGCSLEGSSAMQHVPAILDAMQAAGARPVQRSFQMNECS